MGKASEIAAAVFGAMFETTLEALLVLELPGGRIVAANLPAADLLMTDVDGVVGRTLGELCYEPRDVSRAGYYEELALRRVDDYPVYVTLQVATVEHPAHGALAACAARDMTERRGLERELVAKHSGLLVAHAELEAAYAELNAAKEQLAERNREIALLAWRAAVGELVSGIAHHLNNPVGALGSTLRSMRRALQSEPPDPVALLRLLDRATQLSGRIESNVNAIVTASKQATASAPASRLSVPTELAPIFETFATRMDAIPTKGHGS